MILRMPQNTSIENPRFYDAYAVDELRTLLAAGVPARSDPRRQHIYEVESAHDTFYLLVSPINGSVVLVAKWSRQRQDACRATPQHQAA
jgi:hypothetical protein